MSGCLTQSIQTHVIVMLVIASNIYLCAMVLSVPNWKWLRVMLHCIKIAHIEAIQDMECVCVSVNSIAQERERRAQIYVSYCRLV